MGGVTFVIDLEMSSANLIRFVVALALLIVSVLVLMIF